MNLDLEDLNFETMANWSYPIRAAVVAAVAVAIIAIGYWFDTSAQLQALDDLANKQLNLSAAFEVKQQKAANLHVYKQQLADIKEHFSKMLHKLPSKTEIPGLLEDISKMGVASGLKFRLFDPLQEEPSDFYVQLPIRIAVLGEYHNLATFVSRIAALDRIVTLHDFELMPVEDLTTRRSDNNVKTDDLHMSITAKIYRYSEDD